MRMPSAAGAATAVILSGLSLPASADTLNIIGAGISGNVAISSDTTLWSLLDNVTTSTPAGDNGKNAILRYYVVASGSNGNSVFSLGELNPSFGGTNTAPFVSSSGGSLSLVDPNAGASGRDVSNLTSLHVFAAAAMPTGPGGQSTNVQLSGLVNNPGNYSLTSLQTGFAASQLTVGADTYTGIPLWKFLNPSELANARNQIVITAGTDGYEVVLSLAELDPALGGNPNNFLPYADTNGDFPTDGVARTIFPLDNKHGRWESNLDFVEVAEAAPEPSTWAMMILGFAGIAAMTFRRRKHAMAAA